MCEKKCVTSTMICRLNKPQKHTEKCHFFLKSVISGIWFKNAKKVEHIFCFFFTFYV